MAISSKTKKGEAAEDHSKEDADVDPDEISRQEEEARRWATMTRLERKRMREKRRRDEFSSSFTGLMSVLLRVNPVFQEEARIREQRRAGSIHAACSSTASTSSGGKETQRRRTEESDDADNPLFSRVELVLTAISSLESLHRKSEDLTNQLRERPAGTDSLSHNTLHNPLGHGESREVGAKTPPGPLLREESHESTSSSEKLKKLQPSKAEMASPSGRHQTRDTPQQLKERLAKSIVPEEISGGLQQGQGFGGRLEAAVASPLASMAATSRLTNLRQSRSQHPPNAIAASLVQKHQEMLLSQQCEADRGFGTLARQLAALQGESQLLPQAAPAHAVLPTMNPLLGITGGNKRLHQQISGGGIEAQLLEKAYLERLLAQRGPDPQLLALQQHLPPNVLSGDLMGPGSSVLGDSTGTMAQAAIMARLNASKVNANMSPFGPRGLGLAGLAGVGTRALGATPMLPPHLQSEQLGSSIGRKFEGTAQQEIKKRRGSRRVDDAGAS